jgi:hypothetical protein
MAGVAIITEACTLRVSPSRGAVRLGALNLYRDRPGPPGDEQHAGVLFMTDVAGRAVLGLQAGAPPGPPGTRARSALTSSTSCMRHPVRSRRSSRSS